MIRSIHRSEDGQCRFDLKPDDFALAITDESGLLWVDMQAEPPETCEPILRQTFEFHPLAIDDALRESHVPKVDDWGEYLYLVLHAVVLCQRDGDPVDTLELDVFFGRNYVVTYHEPAIDAVDRVWNLAQRDGRYLAHGPDHLLYRLVDELVAGYMPLADQMDDTIDKLEDRILEEPTSSNLEQILALKRGLHHLRRVIAPQREVLNKLARGDYAVIDADDRMFFRDVYDHLVRLYDINESMRDLVSDALSTYLSVVNNRMNDIMKTLTVITTLFMPISFVVGFFGQNFFQPVADPLMAWTGVPWFVLALIVMIALPLSMYLWIRRRGWM
ncbi:MAG: magnesium/cobalt transporter CorA [Anaerolineae bacterium]|nr:magnesium/cobalt transporter CorA [Anaerolineae bacterium]